MIIYFISFGVFVWSEFSLEFKKARGTEYLIVMIMKPKFCHQISENSQILSFFASEKVKKLLGIPVIYFVSVSETITETGLK